MITLKGVTWDHPRGYQPLRAIASEWKKKRNVDISWDIRTLKEFGDYPIELLINLYDFIILDHPYVGSASTNKLLLSLDDYLPRSFLKMQEEQSIGEGFNSYWYNNHCWALPIDAAAQVAAFRKDITDLINWTLPKDVTKLIEAATELPNKYSIGVPLCPTDIWCVFLTLCAQYANGNAFIEDGIDLFAGEWALEQIRSWKPFLHNASFNMNPIQMLEYMSEENDIIYIPFSFGYTNYARLGLRNKPIHFCNSPKYNPEGKSSILGGAGLAISANTNHLKECLDFMQFILSVDVQKGAYYQNGGQPAHLAAWLNEENNRDCSGFFSDTMDTMNNAFVRPRHEGFNRFQEKGAGYIHENALGKSPARGVIQKLNVIYKTICNERV
jgi:multiple sugar transport system substrate-binding protein